MPAFDKTGPQGQGSMTGRGMGRCGKGLGQRMGYCCGRGYGRGLGRYFGWNKPQTNEEKRKDLQDYKKALEEELEEVKKEELNIEK